MLATFCTNRSTNRPQVISWPGSNFRTVLRSRNPFITDVELTLPCSDLYCIGMCNQASDLATYLINLKLPKQPELNDNASMIMNSRDDPTNAMRWTYQCWCYIFLAVQVQSRQFYSANPAVSLEDRANIPCISMSV